MKRKATICKFLVTAFLLLLVMGLGPRELAISGVWQTAEAAGLPMTEKEQSLDQQRQACVCTSHSIDPKIDKKGNVEPTRISSAVKAGLVTVTLIHYFTDHLECAGTPGEKCLETRWIVSVQTTGIQFYDAQGLAIGGPVNPQNEAVKGGSELKKPDAQHPNWWANITGKCDKSGTCVVEKDFWVKYEFTVQAPAGAVFVEFQTEWTLRASCGSNQPSTHVFTTHPGAPGKPWHRLETHQTLVE